MKSKKLNYVAPALMGLHADFEGVICVSGGNPGSNPGSTATNPTVSVNVSQANRYMDGGVGNWE